MKTTTITTPDNYQLSLNIYEPEGDKPRGVVQIIHGMEEHQGRYKAFAEMLTEQGYAVVSSDMRGHGAGAPEFGFFKEKEGYKFLLQDQRDVTAYIKERFGVDKVIIFAHSMGSVIARNLLHTESFDYQKVILSGYPYCPGIIAFGQFLCDVIQAFRGPHYVSGFMQKLALGQFNKSVKNPVSENDWLCSDPEVVRAYDEDPLCGHIFTISAFGDLFYLLRNIRHPAPGAKIDNKLPILAMRGADDACTGFSKGSTDSIHALTSLGFTNIRRSVYSGMRHELINEVEKAKVYREVVAFIRG